MFKKDTRTALLITGFLILLNGCFYITIIPLFILKFISFTCSSFILLHSIFHCIKKQTLKESPSIAPIFYLIIASFFTSLFFHYQDITLSLIRSFTWINIGFCYLLLNYKINENIIYKSIIFFCIIWILCYIYAVISYPSVAFDPSGGEITEINSGRGFYRFKISGSEFIYLLFYWMINKYINSKKIKYLFFSCILFLMIILMLSRQHIIVNLFIASLWLLKDLSLIKKVIFMSSISILSFFIIPQTTIYQNMAELTENQLEMNNGGKDDIRMQAYKYYLFDYNDSLGETIFGNGLYHSKSEWGKSVSKIIENKGLVLSDVGFASLFHQFGIIGIIILGFFFFKIFKQSHDKQHLFIKYYILSILGGNILSHQVDMSITSIAIIVYLCWIQNQQKKIKIN